MDFTEGQIAQLILLIGAISAAVVAIIRELRANRNATSAAAAIGIEQQNRYLETRQAAPVTMQSPPNSTGDGGVDKAVTSLLANAAPGAAPSSGATNDDLKASIDELVLAITQQQGTTTRSVAEGRNDGSAA